MIQGKVHKINVGGEVSPWTPGRRPGLKALFDGGVKKKKKAMIEIKTKGWPVPNLSYCLPQFPNWSDFLPKVSSPIGLVVVRIRAPSFKKECIFHKLRNPESRFLYDSVFSQKIILLFISHLSLQNSTWHWYLHQ